MRIVKYKLFPFKGKEYISETEETATGWKGTVMTKEQHDKKVADLIEKTKKEAVEYYDPEKKAYSFVKPKDWAFMQQSGEVLKNIPATWMQYPNTAEGMVKIIEMEYGEVMAAWKEKMGDKAVSHELVHLASACLHLWRRLNHAE